MNKFSLMFILSVIVLKKNSFHLSNYLKFVLPVEHHNDKNQVSRYNQTNKHQFSLEEFTNPGLKMMLEIALAKCFLLSIKKTQGCPPLWQINILMEDLL